MSSKRRLRRRQCQGKRAYDNKDSAWRAARKTNWIVRTRPLHAYKCQFCRLYHVGHKPSSRRIPK